MFKGRREVCTYPRAISPYGAFWEVCQSQPLACKHVGKVVRGAFAAQILPLGGAVIDLTCCVFLYAGVTFLVVFFFAGPWLETNGEQPFASVAGGLCGASTLTTLGFPLPVLATRFCALLI